MKRVMFIILWPVGFFLMALTMSMGMFAVLGYTKAIDNLAPMTVGKIGAVWALLFWSMPVLGLILGLCGRLPGTHRKREDSHDA